MRKYAASLVEGETPFLYIEVLLLNCVKYSALILVV